MAKGESITLISKDPAPYLCAETHHRENLRCAVIFFQSPANTNRYSSIDGSEPNYNAAGNLIKDYNGYEYEYDYENRITKITKDGNDIADFIYDALGRRIYKYDQVATEPTFYYYNDKPGDVSGYLGLNKYNLSVPVQLKLNK